MGTPAGKLTWLRALGSRRAEAITAILGFFTGFLITDGYTAYQQMLPRLAGIRSYLDSATAHGPTVLEAITAALAGKPWLPLPAVPAQPEAAARGHP